MIGKNYLLPLCIVTAVLITSSSAKSEDSSTPFYLLTKSQFVESKIIKVEGIKETNLEKMITAYKGQIEYCYERRLQANPSLSGSVTVEMAVLEHKIDPTVKNSTLKSTNVESCVLGVFRRMPFNDNFHAILQLTFSNPQNSNQQKTAKISDDKIDERLIVPQTVISESAVQMDFEGFNGCAVLKNGDAQCWNFGDIGAYKIDKLPSKVKAVGVRKFSNCFLLDTGEVYCYGIVKSGRYNRFTWKDAMSIMWRQQPPVKINLSGKAKKLSVGTGESCVILENDGIECWEVPEASYAVTGIPKPKEISVGRDACSLTSNGDVYCWKSPNVNWEDPKEKITNISVVAEKKISNAKFLATGEVFSGVILKSGEVKLWRTEVYPKEFNPPYGKEIEKTLNVKILGMGDRSQICTVVDPRKPQCLEPVNVFKKFPSNVVDMHLGENGGCALLASGTIQCWGTYQGPYPKDTSGFH